MSPLVWSAIIEATWIAQTYLTGKPGKRHLGWAVGIVNMVLWIGFGLASGGYFFTACAGVGILMYAKNYRAERRCRLGGPVDEYIQACYRRDVAG